MNLSTLLFLAFITTAVTASEKQLTVHVVTWNVEKTDPPPSRDLAELLNQRPGQNKPDIIIVGLQEVTVSMADAIQKYFAGDKWSLAIEGYLDGEGYSKVKTVTLLATVLNIYVKFGHVWTKDNVDVKHVMTGYRGFSPNKGGVIVKFDLYSQTFCVINAHFHAHDEELDKRINDYWTIEKGRKELCNARSDYIIWLGDLNFRIDNDSGLNAQTIKNMILNGEEANLLSKDQLQIERISRKDPKIFDHYQEMPITFKPTYKMTPGTGAYNLKRRPAWTDRILFKSESKNEITPVFYKSVESYTQSDHYPVQAQFKIVVDTDKY